MALIVACVLFLGGILSAALTRLIADEFKAWIPWVIQRLIRYSVGRLPESQRKRFEEEWQSHINEIPGEVGKLVVAFGFLSASSKISANAGRARIAAVRIVKRGLDVFLSGICLVFCAPTLVFIALAIRVSGTGPVLVFRERLGADGRTFRMYRFRVTGPVGKFLHRTSLFTLPVFVNVLRGEMTLVGPKALRPS